ncbi:MAG: hypothetical protein ABIA12_00020 [Candidatus Aenigmatarchaeota archaeon]
MNINPGPAKFIPYTSSHELGDVLAYLKGQRLFVSVTSVETEYKAGELFGTSGVFSKDVAYDKCIYEIPESMGKLERDLMFRTKEWQKIFMRVQPIGCAEDVYDGFMHIKSPTTGYPQFSMGQAGIGMSPRCAECGLFVDSDTSCGKYALRKAGRLEGDDMLVRQFKKDMDAGKLTEMEPGLKEFYKGLHDHYK